MFGFKNNSSEVATPPHPGSNSRSPTCGDELESLWEPSQAKTRKSVEQILLERGHVSEEQLAQAKTVQSQTPGKSLLQILQTMNACGEPQILSALAQTLALSM